MPPVTSTLPLAVSMGDPAGIGLDITLAAWRDRSERAVPPFVLYADAQLVRQRARMLGISANVVDLARPSEAVTAFGDAMPVIAVPVGVTVVPGQPETKAARAVIESVERATAAVIAGEAAAIVTNPIAKSVLYDAGFTHPGHTEFLAELANRHLPGRRFLPVMMLAAPMLRVVPLTIHIPLAAVPGAITRTLIFETVRITHESLRRDFAIAQPRLAVCGLNPHAGENGSIGDEELRVIAPAIAELRAEGLAVSGPHSADTLFHAAARQAYDAGICMYHDQALIPIKTLAFDEGVNVTLGLPFVRTSPDHGTAFALAGTGRANPDSFIASCKLARDMSLRRRSAAAAPAI